MSKLIQPSFAGGEVSAAIAARVDLSKRAVAVELAENFVAKFTGGMDSRPGQRFVARAKGNGTTRLLPFEFNTEQTYVLELGDQYMRFHAQGAQILEAGKNITGASGSTITAVAHGYSTGQEVYLSGLGGVTNLNGRNVKVTVTGADTFTITDLNGSAITITGAYTSGGQSFRVYEIATPYLAADLFDLEHAQSADVLTIVHPDYAPRELVRITNTNWTLTEISFEPSQPAPSGLTLTENSSGSGNILKYKVTANSANTFEESLAALSAATLTITGVTQANPAVVTTSVAHGLEYGDEIYIDGIVGMTQLNGRRFLVLSAPSSTTIQLMSTGRTPINSTGYTAYSSGGTIRTAFVKVDTHSGGGGGSGWDITLDWVAAAGAESYNIYRESQGLFSFIGRTDRLSFDDEFIDADESDTAPTAANPFEEGAGFWPGVTGFYQQRQIYANSDAFPNRFWMTQTGVFYNFATSRPLRDDDAIIGTIASRRINEIRHILPLSDLLLMTSGAEFRVKGSGDAAFTPSTINIKPQSFYGSTSLRPVVAGNVALFVSPGQFVREIAYEFATDNFTGRDLTVLARHLVEEYEIVDWTFSQSPYSVVWAVRDDGVGLILTYQKEQEVYAWTRATTGGLYKSVACVREGDIDAIYLLVERTINGNLVKFIERVDERQFSELSDAFCVDAGLSLDVPITITNMTAANPVVVTAPAHGLSNGDIVDISGVYEVDASSTQRKRLSTDYNGTGFTVANVTTNTFELQNAGSGYNGSGFAVFSSGGVVRKAVTTLTGLWHLEGASVVAAANGYAQTGITVTNGSITLNTPASRVHVGLPYICRLITLPISTYAEGETIQGRAKNITSLTVQVERTMGMWTGPSVDQMREAKFGLPSKWGQPLDMITDDIEVTLKADWDKKKQVVVEQRSPLPMTILALVPDITLGGR
jgi:hypothetical protein